MRAHNFSIIDKLGNQINGATTLSEALEQANLNWNAKETEVNYSVDGELRSIPNLRTLYRSDNGDSLGIVGNKYKVIQNDEAFAVAESLLGEMSFVRGGAFGAQTSVTMRAADSDIDGDIIKNYITLRNSFDGSTKLQVCYIPVRQVCENGLCVEIPGMKRVFELPHVGDIGRKYQELFIKNALGDGIAAIKKYAESLLQIKVSPYALTEILDKFFPINVENLEEGIKIVSTNKNNKNLQIRAEIAAAMNQEDLANYNGTAYQIFQALCDFETHSMTVISKKPEIAARQQFFRAFTGFSVAKQVMDYIQKSKLSV